MLNNRFIVRYSEHLAERIERDVPDPDPLKRTARLYDLTMNRAPTADEASALSQYIQKHGLPNACRVILNSNEIMFVN